MDPHSKSRISYIEVVIVSDIPLSFKPRRNAQFVNLTYRSDAAFAIGEL